MKISLIYKDVKFDKTQIINITTEEINMLTMTGLITKKQKKYLIYFNYRTYQLLCPIIKNEKGEFTAIIPAFKYTNSNIPIFVHLYAVALYLSSRISMRKVAIKVRKMFGLETFSHSTISRTLKKMICNLEEDPSFFSNNKNSDDSQKVSSMDKDTHPYCDSSKIVTRKHWKNDYIDKVSTILTFLLPVLSPAKEDIICNGTQLSYDCYHKNNRYCA